MIGSSPPGYITSALTVFIILIRKSEDQHQQLQHQLPRPPGGLQRGGAGVRRKLYS